MQVDWYKAKTVQKGRDLHSPDEVVARLKEIRDNPKSSYHKALKEGRLTVLYHHQKHFPRYQIQEVEVLAPPIGNATCGECVETYFTLDDDYLCPKCREDTET